jgi:hypothetical protein
VDFNGELEDWVVSADMVFVREDVRASSAVLDSGFRISKIG